MTANGRIGGNHHRAERRRDASTPERIAHFVRDGRTLCGLVLETSEPAAAVNCPRCLVIATDDER